MSPPRQAIPSAALFLDRDGTLIHNAHYLSDPDAVALLPTVFETIAALVASGASLFLFTNQSGVGRGYFTVDAVHACNARMLALLKQPPDLFTDTCIATEAPDATPVYRKPSPRFIHEMIRKHRLDPARCWMVGDTATDVRTGQNAGIHCAAVLTGRPEDRDHLLATYGQAANVPICENLAGILLEIESAL